MRPLRRRAGDPTHERAESLDDLLVDASEPTVERHSVRRNATALMGSQLVTWVLALLVTTYQSRVLGPDGIGQLRIASSLWAIAAIFIAMGSGNLIVIELARDNTRTKLVNRMVALQFVLYLVSWPVVMAFALAAGYSSSVLVLVAIAGLSVAPATISNDGRASFYGFERMTQPSVTDIAYRAVSAVLIVVVLAAGGRVLAASIVFLISATIHAVLIVGLLRRATGYQLRPSFTGLKKVAQAGLPFLMLDATLIVYSQVDTVIMSVLVNSDEIGYYAASSQLYGTLLFVPTVLMTTIFPVFARLDESDPEGLVHLTRRGMRFLLLAAAPIGFGTICLARPVCTLLFGAEFEPAGDVLAVYGVVTMLTYPIMLLAQYAIATGQRVKWMGLLGIAIVLTIPLDLLLIPFARDVFGHGAAGGAMASVITEGLMVLIACVTFLRHLIDRTVIRRAVACLAIGGVMFGATWPFRERFLAIPIVVGAVVYCALLALCRVLDPDESELVRSMSARAVRPLRRSRAD